MSAMERKRTLVSRRLSAITQRLGDMDELLGRIGADHSDDAGVENSVDDLGFCHNWKSGEEIYDGTMTKRPNVGNRNGLARCYT